MITVVYFDKDGNEKYDRLESSEEVYELYNLEDDEEISDLTVYNDEDIFYAENTYLIMGTCNKSDFFDYITDEKEALDYINSMVEKGACLSDMIVFTKGERCEDYRDGHCFINDLKNNREQQRRDSLDSFFIKFL